MILAFMWVCMAGQRSVISVSICMDPLPGHVTVSIFDDKHRVSVRSSDTFQQRAFLHLEYVVLRVDSVHAVMKVRPIPA